ncbi:hypothetical protein ABLB90_14265 [Photorhabdus bodei]|uniref:Uncharacterized protein n=1 Tax=Photorhabdus kayaii TaxID=230088 RepID=A0ABX0B148_9GAMM|nr:MULTISPECIES: hypothetical protein [Photorhabdus]MCC8372932.1 hypothetical protein [Photorhabdus bodei]MDB6368050.1 hypothetical protein [Photorhabdus bodei]NDL13108.1 hypothetical protein [Photorhabdus kayaii]NDL26837.1 hypothetical protein [Photorhabdus kayaii]
MKILYINTVNCGEVHYGHSITLGLPFYTLWISRCIAAARERIPGSIDNDVTGVSESSQQRGNLKDDGYSE